MKILIRVVLVSSIIMSCSSEKQESIPKTQVDNGNTSESFQEPQVPFNPKHYVCYRTDKALQIDGRMTESTWQKAEWTDEFIDIVGPAKPKPRFRTRCKMLWDSQYFYIVAQMEESDVWATLKKRESIIFYDNDFEVFIDPNGDTHRYYELEINALSTEWDLFLDKPYRDGCRAMFFWDIGGLLSKVSVDGTINTPGDKDTGWTLEIAIPWQVLEECADKDAPPKSGDQWRVNFSRVEWQVNIDNGRYVKVIDPKTTKPLPEDNWVWSPQGLVNMHYPEMWGFVQFSEKIAGTGTDDFISHPEENAKWALRQVYYKERKFFLQNNCFTDDISELGLLNDSVEGYRWPPQIKHTWNLFEAKLTSLNGAEEWHIRNDGLVWESK
jgi:hypothetical protein